MKNGKIARMAAFFVPLLVILIICIDHEVYPFGEQCILDVDMYHQYCPFFTELMEKIKNGGSAFYSWNIGLGADFVSLYAYYLASPLNWFLAICPSDHVIEFMTILIVLKIALSGLTFTHYLLAHFDSGKNGVTAFAAAIFGCAYALSGFMAAYSWNIMWTDCMVLAPLIILGLERLIKEGRPLLYYGMLALSILSNYYISIMICIFLVLWFLIYWLEHRENGIKPWLRFAGYSILAGGTGAILIIPTAIVLGYSSTQGTSFPDAMEWYFNIIPELARHMLMTESYTGTEHWPNIYCGVFVLVFFVLYLLNRSISWKSKVSRVLLLVFFVLSFANNILDFFWHGLRFPTSLPGRQTFLYVFVLLMVAYEAFLHLKKNRIWHLGVAAVCVGGFVMVAYHFSDPGLIGQSVFVVSGIFIGCYLVLMAGYLLGNVKVRKVMLAIGCFAMVAELTLNYDVTGFETVSRYAYVKDLADYSNVLKQADAACKEEEQLFYRTEELERKTKNDAALFGYRSATQFSSLMNINVSHFYQNVGMEGGKNFYCINGATPLLSAMLSVRYVLADNDMEANPMRTLVTASGGTYLYENAHVLPLGFMMSEDVIDTWAYEDMGDITAQNQLAQLLGADSLMLEPAGVSVAAKVGESSFLVEETGYYYGTYEKTSAGTLTLETSDGRSRSYSKASHGYTLELGYCEAGTRVAVTNTVNETLNMTVYRLNPEVMQTAFDTLNEQTMELTSFSDDKLTGRIQVEEAGRLIFSIAQEDGWTLYVDGEVTEADAFCDAFISVHLEPGVHDIELRYKTPGFALGLAISDICIFIAALCMFVRWKNGRLL